MWISAWPPREKPAGDLDALAALAATASFAQSTVTLSGLLDFSYYGISGSATTAAGKAQSVGTTVGSATSAINFNAVEDLGGGLKAQAFYAIDPRAFANDGSALARHETYVGLSGGFGNLRMGAINTAALGVNGVSNAFGTATGGAYAWIESAAGGAVRFNRSVRYDTPTFSGFSANLTFAPGNDDASAVQTAGSTLVGQKVTDLGLNYSNGPLNVAFSSLQRSALTGGTASQVKSTYNSIAVNYAIGNAKIFAGYADGDKSSQAPSSINLVDTTGGLDSKVNRVGATYTMGAVTLLGQYSTAEIGTAAKRKATGLRADYALSKRTTAYAVYEAFDTGATSANKINTAAVGVRHSF